MPHDAPAPSSRSSRRSGPHASIRPRIVEAATRLFARHGFDGTSLQQVAEEVGIRKPSVLYHFPSKVDLREAVMGELLVCWSGSLPRLKGLEADGEFTQVARAVASFFLEDRDRAALLLRELLDRPEATRARLAEHLRPVVQRLAVRLRKGQERGHIALEADPEGYLFHTFVSLLTAVATAPTFGRVFEADEARLVTEALRNARVALLSGSAASTSSERELGEGARPGAGPPASRPGSG